MPHTIPDTDHPADVTDNPPPPADQPQTANPTGDRARRHASDRDLSEGRTEPAGSRGEGRERRRPKPEWVNPNTVIGSLIGVIGVVIVFTLGYGIQSIDTRFESIDARFDDQNTAMNARFDDMHRYIEARFDDQDNRLDGMDNRLDGMDDRLAAVEGEVKGLRQEMHALNNATNARIDRLRNDTNARIDHTNGRLDVLIALLETQGAIPADIVPKSATAPPSP